MVTVTEAKEDNDKETDRERSARETRRLQFEFSDKLVEEIDQLVKDLDASSRGEVIRLALGLLKVAARGRDEGAKVVLEEGDVKKEIVLPIAGSKR